jgi:hypothetical protein
MIWTLEAIGRFELGCKKKRDFVQFKQISPQVCAKRLRDERLRVE